MENERYGVANLSDTTIQQVQSFEKTLSEKNGEDIVVIAYKSNSKVKK